MAEKLTHKKLLTLLRESFDLTVELVDTQQDNKKTLLELPMRLTEVSALKVYGDFESYSIIFHGPAQPLLPQGTYPLQHSVLGRQSLFLVPISASEQYCEYEAVMSCLQDGR